MKILFVSNLYPPHFMGGYEITCKTVVEELEKRGHHVAVLTSTWRSKIDGEEENVFRRLNYFPRSRWRYIFKIFFAEIVDRKRTKKVINYFHPDLIFIWNFAGLSRSVLHLLHSCFEKVVYNVFDYWPVGEFQNECLFHLFNKKVGTLPISGINIPAQPIKFLLRAVFTLFRIDGTNPDLISKGRFIFNSNNILNFCSRRGFTPVHYEVIHGGISKREFPLTHLEREPVPHKLLYVGRLVPEKGVHTAIEVLFHMVKVKKRKNLTLTVVGGGPPSYIQQLRKLVRDKQLSSHIVLKGVVQRALIKEEYLFHDILLFPSQWEEPFGLAILEAMACGLAVVGTGTGGSSEILENEYNCLLFPPECSHECAQQIERLISHPDLFHQLRENGQKTVKDRFYLEDKVDEIESFLDSHSR